MRTLVTGGAGFIGSNLVDGLLERGDEVAVLDDFSSGKEENLRGALERGAQVHRADVRNPLEVDDVVAGFKPESIFHLAAQIDVRKSIADPAYDARTNVEGTINVLEAARRAGVRRFVNISTGGAIYGETDVLPTPETVEPRPEAAYGTSKFCAERYCGLFQRLYGLSTVTARFGNVYGPRQDPHGEAGVIAIFTGKLVEGGTPRIYGTGEQTRDYVYVGDVVSGLIALHDAAGAHAEFNIGTGVEASVLDIVSELRGYADGAFEPELAPARQGELDRSCLDVTKARETLGWRAEVGLAEGLKRTVEWARNASGRA